MIASLPRVRLLPPGSNRAQAAAQQLSAGGPVFDISKVVRNVSPEEREAERWQAYVSRLGTQPGIIVAEQKMDGGNSMLPA